MRLRAISEQMDVVNVRDFGAIGGSSSADTAGFQAAMAALPTYGGVVLVPRSSSNYLLTADVFASLSARKTVEMWLFGILETDVTQIVRRDCVVKGFGRADSVDSGVAMGGSIRASSTFSTGGSPVVFLGDTGVASHGCRLENLLIDGRARAQWGVKADSLQELSGLRHVQIQNTDNGVQIINSAESSTNCLIEDVEIYLKSSSAGYGMDVYSARSSPITIRRCTVNHGDGVAVANSVGYRLYGQNIIAESLFAESCQHGIQIGDGSTTTRNINVRGAMAYNGAGTSNVAWIRSGDMENIRLEALFAGSMTNLVKDDKAGITLDASTYGESLTYYDHGKDSYTRTVRTSAHDWNFTYTAAAGDTNDVAIAGASTMIVTANSAGTSALTGMAGGYKGRRVLITNASAYTLTLKNATGSAAGNQFRCTTGANISLAQNECAEAVYGVGSSTTEWLVWKL